MSIKSRNTPLFSDNWSPGFGSMFSIFRDPNRKAFSKLKEIYGSELMKVHQQKLISKPLTKEEKNKIKDKITTDLKKQRIKNIFILSFSIIVSLLILYVISVSLKNYFEI